MFNKRIFTPIYLLKIGVRTFKHQNRHQHFPQERLSPNDLLWKIIEEKTIKNPKDWKSVRTQIQIEIKNITPASIDAMTVGVCTSNKKFDLALSYLEFLKNENIDLNLATIGKYFKLLYVRGVEESLTPEDEDRILEMYADLRTRYPILDSLTLESTTQALSLTKKWTLCLDLLKEIKVTSSPTSHTYSAVIAAAFSNKSDELAWKLLDELIESNKAVKDVVYTSYFKRNLKDTEKIDEIERMFYFMQKNGVKVEPESVGTFVDAFRLLNLAVRSSNVHTRGICKCCNKKLQTFELTDEEFNNLKAKIIKNVIVGKDVYNKTTADELEKFNHFISSMEKFDIIIDGLNVAYSIGVKQPSLVTSGLVASVVRHFISEGKKVLVLGRKHMKRWPSKNWNYVQQNAATFLTEDLSQDDPYLLYCALNSGKDTVIVTRDLMRSHKFLLREVHLKLLFDRWLSQRQFLLVRVQESGKPIFKKPLPFSQVAQKNEGYWHIPCTSFVTSSSTNWLCIKL